MRHLPSLIAAALLAAPAALAAQPVTKDASAPAPKLVATLVPGGAGRLQGTLTLEKGRKDNESRARVTLLNAPASAQLGWVIRKGACGENLGELGSIAAYRPLQTRGDGSVELAVYLPMALPSSGAYHIDILQERGSDVVLACGGISEDTPK
jgi:hypothetical protein